MARISTVICGWMDDKDNPDWRATLGPNCILLGSSSLPILTRSGPDTRALFWNVRTLFYTYNITLPNGSIIAGTGNINPVSVISDERALPCATEIINLIVSTDWAQSAVPVVDYDKVTGDFIYQPRFTAVGLSNQPGSFASPVAASITADFMGIPIPFFVESGDTSTGGLSIHLPATGAYWPYDNGLSALPTDGPIFDTDTGAQLIAPVPPDFI